MLVKKKRKRKSNYVTSDITISSDDSDKVDSGKENTDEEN